MSVFLTIVLKTGLESLGLTFLLRGLLMLAIGMSYLWFGVKACRHEAGPIPAPPGD